MKMRLHILAWLCAAMSVGVVHAVEPDGREILDRVEKLLWGQTVQGRYEMHITTPGWKRSLQLAVWMERPDKSFIRILAPAKEAGIGSLRIKTEMWNYLPNVERVIKIPPSMMLQPWMGSDFTNDDLVKESSITDDYTHRILNTGGTEQSEVWQIEALPKPNAPVIWGKIIYTVRRVDFMPLKQEFFSERGDLIRVLTFSDARPVGGRTIPTRWEMRSQLKAGNVTTIVVKDAVYDRPVDAGIFTQRNLRAP
jgi:outer membrane lipoprotein-sorting protein